MGKSSDWLSWFQQSCHRTVACLLVASVIAHERAAAQIVPAPKSFQLLAGSFEIGPRASICTPDVRLTPTAKALAGALQRLGAGDLSVIRGYEGDIRLLIDPKLRIEEYRIAIDRGIRVEGGSTRAVAWGASALLQAAQVQRGNLAWPRMSVSDHPDLSYRGVMVDVARRYHSIATLEQCVVLCWIYRIPYLQLHLTDDQAFTFPSASLPLAGLQNQHGGPRYTIQELEGLVAFADARGVAIVPEIDVPGHSAALIRAYPELFKIAGTKPYEHHATINFADDKAVDAVSQLLREVANVFSTSPYIHIGGDEADYSNADQHHDFQEKGKNLGLSGSFAHHLYRRFLVRMNDTVQSLGKQMIVWEGFGRDPSSPFQIPKNVLVMEFESAYYSPLDLLNDGYSVINAAWTPLYAVNRHVWPIEQVLQWDVTKFGTFSSVMAATRWFKAPSRDGIVGAQVCAWEQPEWLTMQNLKGLAPAMAERTWNAGSGLDVKLAASRIRTANDQLNRILYGVVAEFKGLKPVTESDFDGPSFESTAQVRLNPILPGHLVRYTVDGSAPTAGSRAADGWVTLDRTTTVRARAFSKAGTPDGYEQAWTLYLEPSSKKSLATGKPVRASSGTQGGQTPDLAVDGKLDLGSSWWAAPWPQWLEVDLGKAETIGMIEVFPYWGGGRTYQYVVEVSIDQVNWTKIVDQSANTKPAVQTGDRFTVTPVVARYVRITMLHNSTNEGVHLVELHVWGPHR